MLRWRSRWWWWSWSTWCFRGAVPGRVREKEEGGSREGVQTGDRRGVGLCWRWVVECGRRRKEAGAEWRRKKEGKGRWRKEVVTRACYKTRGTGVQQRWSKADRGDRVFGRPGSGIAKVRQDEKSGGGGEEEEKVTAFQLAGLLAIAALGTWRIPAYRGEASSTAKLNDGGKNTLCGRRKKQRKAATLQWSARSRRFLEGA